MFSLCNNTMPLRKDNACWFSRAHADVGCSITVEQILLDLGATKFSLFTCAALESGRGQIYTVEEWCVVCASIDHNMESLL